MKKIKFGTIQYYIYLIVIFSIVGMILFPLFDYILCMIFTHSDFVYSINDYIIHPIVISVVFACVLWITNKKKD